MMFSGLYPTELSLEAFYPHYLDPQFTHLKPSYRGVNGENGFV